jgi:60 kDa SS-A/Ro ribonucleoprotein
MLRNFVQIIRSGETDQKSLNRASRNLISGWLNSRDDFKLLEASIGNDPSLADVIKLAHPKPQNKSREAFYGWMLDREYDARRLPTLIKQYEAYKKGESTEVPEIPFQLLTALDLGKKEWTEIAKGMKWHATRMNLNTLKRHGVFEDKAMIRMVADRLADAEQVRNAKVFPYQLYVAYQNAVNVPMEVREALQDAMEIATENISEINGQVVILPDISGSMSAPITGQRGSATTTVTCRDMAALISAAIARKNPRSSRILPFSDRAHTEFSYNPRDSVMTIASKLAQLPAGGTDCSAPMKQLNDENVSPDLIIYVSDNQSWVDSSGHYGVGGRAPQTMEQFEKLKKRNPKAKLVMLDGAPGNSTQAAERKDILNIGGFSDDVFEIISEFAKGRLGADHWVGEIERISL